MLPRVGILHGHLIKAWLCINISISTGAVWSKLSGNIRKAPSTLSYHPEDQRAGCLRLLGPFAFFAIIIILAPSTAHTEQAKFRESHAEPPVVPRDRRRMHKRGGMQGWKVQPHAANFTFSASRSISLLPLPTPKETGLK